MYDRKTWIVVAICVVLLGLNTFYMNKERQAFEAQRKIEEAQRAAEEAASPKPATPETAAPGELTEVEPKPAREEQLVTLETPKATFTLSSYGGGVKTVLLKDQTPGVLGPVQLNRHGSNPVGAFSTTLDSFESTTYEYVAAESEEGKKVVFRGKLTPTLTATKTWSIFESGTGSAYQLNFSIDLKNTGTNGAALDKYSIFLGAAAPVGLNERIDGTQLMYLDGGSLHTVGAGSFASGFFGMKKAKDLVTETPGKLEFAGVADQFFATVLRPLEPTSSLLWTKVEDVHLGEKTVKAIRAGASLPKVEIPAGESRTFGYQIFTGPKENYILRKMSEEQGLAWGEVMNYGMWSPFSRFMNRALIIVHDGVDGFTGKASWGVAVVLLTIVIRIAIWPLYNRSNRTAKRMSKLKPEMDKLREKYPDDPNKVGQETMKLYRTYGINPLGSCLPMFAQLPIFMGFFSMLNHAVELRGHSFLWIHDLAEPDTFGHLMGIPINILPILMAITSMIQMAMMPNTGGDKAQIMMMRMMPLMFLFICYNSAAALALYWTTSNIFSIGQTWLSNRLPEPELKPAKKAGGKSFMERMAEKAEQAQKAQNMRNANGRVVDDSTPTKKRPPRTGG